MAVAGGYGCWVTNVSVRTVVYTVSSSRPPAGPMQDVLTSNQTFALPYSQITVSQTTYYLQLGFKILYPVHLVG